ncbi:beta-lactamase family protein [Sphingomonas sp. BT-65]|uniref:serine hydrolase domain-containing protein n=1 Tax=Sphingomonas sp. BT-65 TaxID=2989821 RepID=UPI0022360DD3|nr:serine hydrolase domain-containing protein [Sphingomonas sp. BT-65]MCW4461432.1 beta-lactamase family protein [Sphingomonas sp. BT-65]
MQRAMRETGAKGLAIATIDRGRVTWFKAFGVRNAKGDPLTPDTVMYGASLTKAVVGYFAAAMASEKRLDLDRPIAAMLPRPLPDYGNVEGYSNWGDLAGDPRWRVITPRMVLNHSTGFANFAFLEPDGRLRIHFDPGTRYGYSGEGMTLLQFGIERGAGLSLEAELQRRFFKPLGMARTSLVWNPAFASNLADGWDEKGQMEPHDERSRVRAAGSMDTTLRDFATMAAAMVRGYGMSRGSRAGFARGTLPITTAQQFPTLLPDAPPAERPRASAALGVIAFNGPQGAGWLKGGHNDTTANTLVCLERGRRCVLILSNDVRAERAFPALVRAALGETGVPYRWEYPGLPAY